MDMRPEENAKRMQRQKTLNRLMLPVILFVMAISPLLSIATLLTRGPQYSFHHYGILWGITIIEIHMFFKIMVKTSLFKIGEVKPSEGTPTEVKPKSLSFFAPWLIFLSCFAFICMIVGGINPFFAVLVGFYGSYFSIYIL